MVGNEGKERRRKRKAMECTHRAPPPPALANVGHSTKSMTSCFSHENSQSVSTPKISFINQRQKKFRTPKCGIWMRKMLGAALCKCHVKMSLKKDGSPSQLLPYVKHSNCVKLLFSFRCVRLHHIWYECILLFPNALWSNRESVIHQHLFANTHIVKGEIVSHLY